MSTFNVTVVSNGYGGNVYSIDGSQNPTLSLTRGQTYTFNINAIGHPFWIKTTLTTTSANAYTTGITNNGTQNGAITFSVPSNAPSTLYYACEYHSSMQGVINVVDGTTTTTASPGTTTTTTASPGTTTTTTASPGTTTTTTASPVVTGNKIKITELPSATSITSDDLLVMVDSGNPYVTKKISWGNIDAPQNNVTYGRKNGSWTNLQFNVVTPSGSLSNPCDHDIIQQAINALPEDGGRIFLQAGNYYLSNTINISKPNIEMVGAGRSTQLNCVGNYGNVFKCELPYVPTTAVSGMNGLKFESMRFESTVPRTSGAAIYAAYTHQATFRDLHICDVTYGRTYGYPNAPPSEGGPGQLYYDGVDTDDPVAVAQVALAVPTPIPFYNGIEILGQDQINIDRIVVCASNKGISVKGSNYYNADFSYDGVISKCHLFGIMTGSGVGIHLGPGVGGFLVDYCSLNAWGTGIFCTAIGTTQGGGIVTIRDGFAEGCTIGYKTLNMQNTVVNNLWANIYASGTNFHRLHIIGTMQNHSIEIAGALKALVVAINGSYTTIGNASNFTKIG